MSKEIFTTQELDILFEAIEKWEHGNPMDGLGDAMMMGMMGDRIPPDEKAKLEKERAERERKRNDAARIRKERGVLLRAKIVQLKQDRAVNQLCEEAARETC